MKNLILSATFVAVSSSMALAGSITTSNGASCNDSYNQQQNVGPELSLNSSMTEGGDVNVGVSYKITFKPKNRKVYDGDIQRVDCYNMLKVEEKKQQIELQRMQLELELLKAQVAQAKRNSDVTLLEGDDW